MTVPAILALEDGTLFQGHSIGAAGSTVGEVVFNTAMSGYQEILTDPSYSRQLVTLTYPHIGNTGVNLDDQESDQIQAGGLIIRDLPILPSNWRMEESLSDYLIRQQTVAIADIDTRRLTRHLRTHGAQNGCIMTGSYDADVAVAAAQKFPGLKGMDLAKVVSTKTEYQWAENIWTLEGDTPDVSKRYRVVAYDFGVKRNILRLLVHHGCDVTVVPAETPAEAVLAMSPDGVFLSNGPGDPEPCDYAIDAIKTILAQRIPTFGICLGHQLLALASGARTIKMKFGHHGANHPIQDLASKVVMISSQNHGFAVDQDSLPDHLTATHISLFDQSLQGIARTDTPAFGFQGHPEASPGPHDLRPLFGQFIDMMKVHQQSLMAS
ncbi:MAG: glutamine-hydrolyzing carbamoyl-phosphate synthase small subunit [Pseudomonadota bacterium]